MNVTKIMIRPVEAHASCPPWGCVAHAVEVVHGALDYRMGFEALAAASPALADTLAQIVSDPSSAAMQGSVLHESRNYVGGVPGVSLVLQRTDAISATGEVTASPEVAVLSLPYFGDVLLMPQNVAGLAAGLQAAAGAFAGIDRELVPAWHVTTRPPASWYGSSKAGFCGAWSPTGGSQCLGKAIHRGTEHHSLSESWSTATGTSSAGVSR